MSQKFLITVDTEQDAYPFVKKGFIGIEEGIKHFVDWYLSYYDKSPDHFSTSPEVSVHAPTP